jgi:hypothetical protein
MQLQTEAFWFFLIQEGLAEPRPLRGKREDAGLLLPGFPN